MKKILFIFSFSMISSVSFGQTQKFDTIRYAKEHYQERIAVFEKEPIVKQTIIFLGNSLTEFGDWKKLLNDSSTINRGIGGDNTFGILDRLQDVIDHQPSKLFLEVGINDISQNIPSRIILDNIILISKKIHAKSPGTRIYIISILPTNDKTKTFFPGAFGKNERVRMINEQLKMHAKENKYTYVDLSSAVRDEEGNLSQNYARPDGLHINNTGYDVWVKLLKTKKYL